MGSDGRLDLELEVDQEPGGIEQQTDHQHKKINPFTRSATPSNSFVLHLMKSGGDSQSGQQGFICLQITKLAPRRDWGGGRGELRS